MPDAARSFSKSQEEKDKPPPPSDGFWLAPAGAVKEPRFLKVVVNLEVKPEVKEVEVILTVTFAPKSGDNRAQRW
ncbi:MAG: hypothetical protein D6743_19445 [Calditrichaeota bacterium]|nr:MAG: hypothetical protein D6743_19445 [Calditrichota bacterium]